MTSPARRLEGLSSTLTARERLKLVLREWVYERPLDRRLTDYAPPDQREELDRWLEAIDRANGHLVTVLAFHVEWLRQIEVHLGWYESLVPLLRHFGSNAGPRPARLPIMPPPGWGFRDELPVLWGSRSPSPVPASWEEAPAAMLGELARAVEGRWNEFLALESVCQEFSARFDEQAVHHRLAEALPVFRTRLLEVAGAVGQHGVALSMADAPTDKVLEEFRGYVPWDDLPSAPARPERQLPWKEKEAIEAFEAEQAEMLRREGVGE